MDAVVYRKKSESSAWQLLIDGQWWYLIEDTKRKKHYWFRYSDQYDKTWQPKGVYESSALAFLACTGKTIEQSFKEGANEHS